jgi:hypothetical protein
MTGNLQVLFGIDPAIGEQLDLVRAGAFKRANSGVMQCAGVLR